MGWNFDNSYAALPEILFRRVKPVAVSQPKMLLWNEALARELGVDDARAEIFSGNVLPQGSDPIAQAYAGHQFGHFTMLGDGRALLLGEQVTPSGARFDVQLKGSGPTPFSRNGDGRAALGPMLREYIISEAMHALKIPTTRSLAVVTTGETVYREEALPGAILTRIARSHIRVGTFEYVSAVGDPNLLQTFFEYARRRHYPNAQTPLEFVKAVMETQASLVAKWMAVGFIHGVMNTDNVAISGETIDYGPCAFLDVFDPSTVFSSIDHRGRYAFGNQVPILQWNLARFAETLLPLMDLESAKAMVAEIPAVFQRFWLAEMRKKLGLVRSDPADQALIENWLELLAKNRADYTNSFYALTTGAAPEGPLASDPQFHEWHAKWRARTESRELMMQHNPSVIPRNSLVERALREAQQGDLIFTRRLLAALAQPFAAPAEYAEFRQTPAPDPDFQTFCGT